MLLLESGQKKPRKQGGLEFKIQKCGNKFQLVFRHEHFALEGSLECLLLLVTSFFDQNTKITEMHYKKNIFHFHLEYFGNVSQLEEKAVQLVRLFDALQQKVFFPPTLQFPLHLHGAEHQKLCRFVLKQIIDRFPLIFDDTLLSLHQDFCHHQEEMFFQERGMNFLVKILLQLFLMMKRQIKNPNKQFCRCLHYPKTTFWREEIVTGIAFAYYIEASKYLDEEIFQQKVMKAFSGLVDFSTYYRFIYQEGEVMFFEMTRDVPQKEQREIQKTIALCLQESQKHRLPIAFYPRNEEQEIRFTLLLRAEVSSRHDPTHAAIFFTGYDTNSIRFSMILVHPTQSETDLQELRRRAKKHGMHLMVEKVRVLEKMDKDFNKEFLQCTAYLPMKNYWRKEDDVLDVMKARADVFYFLEKTFTLVRDYNGSMISREKQFLEEMEKLHPSLLVRDFSLFYYRLFPIEQKMSFSPEVIAKFYQKTQEMRKKKILQEISPWHLATNVLCFLGTFSNMQAKNEYQEKIHQKFHHLRPLWLDWEVDSMYIFGGLLMNVREKEWQ